MDLFLYDNGFRLERVKDCPLQNLPSPFLHTLSNLKKEEHSDIDNKILDKENSFKRF